MRYRGKDVTAVVFEDFSLYTVQWLLCPSVWNYKESWVQNWCFWTVVLEKSLESSLGCKEIQPVHPTGDQSWVFIGKTDVEAEIPVLWPPHAKIWLIWKDPDAGKDWGQEEKETTEVEMIGWHHWLNGCGFGWTPGVGDGQGGLSCCGSWGCKESDMTKWMNWTELNWTEASETEGRENSVDLYPYNWTEILKIMFLLVKGYVNSSDTWTKVKRLIKLLVTSETFLLHLWPKL